MKIKIPIKYHNKHCKLESHGNWIDLKSAETYRFSSYGEFRLLNLGVSMKLPKDFQANIVPRSSTYLRFGVIQTNHYGVIDGPTDNTQGYSGNDDVWKFGALHLPIEPNSIIQEGDRICQFEIRPRMFASFWAKLKWFFMTEIEFVEVDDLKTKNRGGFGSTNKK